MHSKHALEHIHFQQLKRNIINKNHFVCMSVHSYLRTYIIMYKLSKGLFDQSHVSMKD